MTSAVIPASPVAIIWAGTGIGTIGAYGGYFIISASVWIANNNWSIAIIRI